MLDSAEVQPGPVEILSQKDIWRNLSCNAEQIDWNMQECRRLISEMGLILEKIGQNDTETYISETRNYSKLYNWLEGSDE